MENSIDNWMFTSNKLGNKEVSFCENKDIEIKIELEKVVDLETEKESVKACF